MKLAILGATGRTGRHLVRIALAAGHEVTAVVRDPGKLGDVRPTRTVVADLRSPGDLHLAFEGADAVASCVGPTGGESHGIQSASTRACLETMATTGVSRVAVISASGPFVAGDDVARLIRAPEGEAPLERHGRGAPGRRPSSRARGTPIRRSGAPVDSRRSQR